MVESMRHVLRSWRVGCGLLLSSGTSRRCLATMRELDEQTNLSNLEPGQFLPYPGLRRSIQLIRSRLERPLTLSEKILYGHLSNPAEQSLERGLSTLQLRPDRAACHDATATMAMLQFISAGLPEVALPTSIHSDHLIVAENGNEADVEQARHQYREVYEFLSSACRAYNIGFWKPGSGIIHTIIFENYAFPGGLIIGTDSHTPNAGGMGMLGIGVGGADAVDAMTGIPWELLCPRVVGVRLEGKLTGWSSSKDIILKLAGITSASGGKGKIFEFFGPGVQSLGATAMATVCNMSAEIGSTSCIFPHTSAMSRYLEATDRAHVANAAKANHDLLVADHGSESYYDEIIDIDLNSLEPHINGPFTPDLSHTLSSFAKDVAESPWPRKISHAMIGSCTNSSYEDLKKTAKMVSEARIAGLKLRMPLFVTAGSEKIRSTAARDGIMAEFEAAGGIVLSNSCGPCVGQWNRKGMQKDTPNSVISSYNRNFVGRHDGNSSTHSFVSSPELVAAFAFAGDLGFNPTQDSILDEFGKPFKFSSPSAEDLPSAFENPDSIYQSPPKDRTGLTVKVDPQSDQLQFLKPFEEFVQGQANDMRVLIKVQGKCTTDHISPAGPWYKYRGHLENISNNLLTAAENAHLPGSGSRGLAISTINGSVDAVPRIAKIYRDAGIRWCIVGDFNYGEGSSREHAALEPRFLGGIAVIARSFARIHETNLKKQGMLALTFADPSKYDDIGSNDLISISCIEDMQPGVALTMHVQRPDGSIWATKVTHSYHATQIQWLRAGSALNYVKAIHHTS